jgi:hypothetical protein
MRKKETDSPERGKTLAPSLIKKLDETILMTKNIKSHLSKCVIELSGMLRENAQSRQEPLGSEMEKMSIMLDRYLKAGQTLSETQESFQKVRTELESDLK